MIGRMATGLGGWRLVSCTIGITDCSIVDLLMGSGLGGDGSLAEIFHVRIVIDRLL